jgi:hypothetical protein
MTPTAYITQLIHSFPCLDSKLHDYYPAEFDADKFHALMSGWSHGEILCAIFVLNVWNPGYAEQQGWRFDLMEFISIADNGNKRALLAWCERPYWP